MYYRRGLDVDRLPKVIDRGFCVGLGLLVFLLHLPYLWPGGPALRHTGFALVFDHDEATVVYDAFRVALGEAAYRDFFNFKGPVFGLVYGAAFKVLGRHWWAAQLVWIFTHAVAMGLTASIVRHLGGRALALFVVFLHGFVLVLFWPRPYEQWLAEGLVIGGTWLLVVPVSREAARLFGAGLLFGLAALTALSSGLPVALAAVALVFLRGVELPPLQLRPALRASGLVTLGVVTGALFALLPSILRGGLLAMYEQTILWPRRAYLSSQPSRYADGKAAIVQKLPELGSSFMRLVAEAELHLVTALPVLLLGLVVLWAMAFLGARRLGPVRRHPGFMLVMIAGAYSAHLVVRGINRDVTHLAFVGGMALLAVAASVSVLRARWPGLRRGLSASFLVLGLLVLSLYGYLLKVSWAESRAQGSWREAALSRFGHPEVAAELGSEASMVYGSFAPGYVYFFVAKAAIPITNFPLSPKRWVGYYDRAQYQWLADAVLKNRPAVMALSGEQWSFLVELRPELSALYRPVPGSQRGYVQLYRPRAPSDGEMAPPPAD